MTTPLQGWYELHGRTGKSHYFGEQPEAFDPDHEMVYAVALCYRVWKRENMVPENPVLVERCRWCLRKAPPEKKEKDG